MSMFNPSAPNDQQKQQDWSESFLPQEDLKPERGFFAWWYGLTAPKVPPAYASLKEREIARRGRLTSLVLFFLVIFVFVGVPLQIVQNPVEGLPLLSLCVPLLLALWFNRRGKINASGSIIVCLFAVGDFAIFNLLQPGHMLSSNSVSSYDLLILSELFAVSLLPPWAVFIAAAYNIALVVINFNILPHTTDLKTLISLAGPDVLIRPIAIYFILAVVTYLWVRSATRAIERADRAEMVAKLEHALAEQVQIIAEQKRALESSIQQIVYVHTRVANGDLSARVPLTEDNVLWEIAGSLNNLLARLQRLQFLEKSAGDIQNHLQWAIQSEQEYVYIRDQYMKINEVTRAAAIVITMAKKQRTPIYVAQTQTSLDVLLQEIHGCYLLPA